MAGGSPSSGVRGRVADLVRPALVRAGFDLEDVEVQRAGSRSVVRVLVDRDGGVDLDAVAEASRLVSADLDAADVIPGAYTLEVSSRGVDRPLTEPRHWRRAISRLVLVNRTSGTPLEGRVLSADETSANLDHNGTATTIAYADVVRALVQVEMKRAAEAEASDNPEDPSADGSPDEGDDQ